MISKCIFAGAFALLATANLLASAGNFQTPQSQRAKARGFIKILPSADGKTLKLRQNFKVSRLKSSPRIDLTTTNQDLYLRAWAESLTPFGCSQVLYQHESSNVYQIKVSLKALKNAYPEALGNQLKAFAKFDRKPTKDHAYLFRVNRYQNMLFAIYWIESPVYGENENLLLTPLSSNDWEKALAADFDFTEFLHVFAADQGKKENADFPTDSIYICRDMSLEEHFNHELISLNGFASAIPIFYSQLNLENLPQ